MNAILLHIRMACAAIRRKIRPPKIGVDPAAPESDITGIIVFNADLSEEAWADILDKYQTWNRDISFKTTPFIRHINDEDWKNIRRN